MTEAKSLTIDGVFTSGLQFTNALLVHRIGNRIADFVAHFWNRAIFPPRESRKQGVALMV